jgi:hypothetical protein
MPPTPPQVTRLHSFAFPLAEVAVAVMAAHPEFVPLLAARLHQVCLLCCCGVRSPNRMAGLLRPPAALTACPHTSRLAAHPCPPGGLPAAPMLQVCPLTVPKYRVFKTGADDDAYLKQLGYKISTDEDTGRVSAVQAAAGWVLDGCCRPAPGSGAGACLPPACLRLPRPSHGCRPVYPLACCLPGCLAGLLMCRLASLPGCLAAWLAAGGAGEHG